ncbi:MAG TPA: hypothetical protein VK502_03745 [Candidatus Saccharimonadales bacterium]|nr:hypothetical protein [Candidatus Saccharimonadales bacterium]
MSVIVALLLGWWAWSYFGPKPLGDRLEYIGRTDYGSWLPLSSSSPTGVYYYATDMSIGEVERYFKGAEMVDQPSNFSLNVQSATITESIIEFKSKQSNQTFLATYINDGQAIQKKENTRKSSKKHIFTIDDNYYTNNYSKAAASL